MKGLRPVVPRLASDLVLDENNANRGTPRGQQLLTDSLKTYGAGRSVLVDRVGRLIAGNQTAARAQALGLPIRVVQTDGQSLVVVQRRDLDLRRDPHARALAVADNRIGELDLQWDPAILQQLRTEGVSFGDLFTEHEWQDLLGTAAARTLAEDAVLEPGPSAIRRGDRFALGVHRLACGDATDAGDVARLLDGCAPGLMVTDPPFGVGYAPGWRHRAYPTQRTAVGRVLNDDQASWPAAYRLFPGNVLFSFHASSKTVAVAQAIEQSGFTLRSQIVWVKSHFALSRALYHYQHESCWFAVRAGTSPRWHGDRKQTTVWTVPNLNAFGGTRTGENAPTGHATQKPVELFRIPIRNHTQPGDAIYDPFVGSGTSVIAAETTGRRAYALDLDPQYVQVVIRRWEQLTGLKARALTTRARSRV